jgi:hypothetical protein
MPSPDYTAPIFTLVPAALRKDLVCDLDHRLSALLAIIIIRDPQILEENRYLYNACLEGSAAMVRQLFEFLGTKVSLNRKTKAPELKKAKPDHPISTTLEHYNLSPADPAYFSGRTDPSSGLSEDQVILRIISGINQRTMHHAPRNVAGGQEINHLEQVARIILWEVRERIYGRSNPIEINEHLVRDLPNQEWNGFHFVAPPGGYYS